MGFVGVSNLPCLNNDFFMQDSPPFLITSAPSVTFGNLHYNV